MQSETQTGCLYCQVLALERVLLVADRSETHIGRPYVGAGARVLAAVEEHFKDGKVHVFR